MIGILKGNPPGTRNAATTPGGDEPTRWIVIAIVSWGEAEVMRSKLESEDIPCLLQREAAGAVFGITIGPLGEVRALVPEPLADRALDVLSTGADDLTEEDKFTDDDLNNLHPTDP